MKRNIKVFSSRKFVYWRYVYTILLMLFAAPFFIFNNVEVGNQPGILLLVFGILPSILYLVLLKFGWIHANMFAYIHDTLIVVGCILMLGLANYYAFIFTAPLAGFVIEWIAATYSRAHR